MKKTVLLFGLLSAAVGVVMMLATFPLMDTLGYQMTDVVGYTAMVVAALLVFFGIRSYRDGPAGGRITFGRGFVVGLLITLVSSVCQVLAFQVVYFRLVPDFGPRFAACMVERVRDSGASDAEILTAARQARTLKRLYDNPLTNAAITFVQPLPIGLAAAAVSAAILRTKKKKEVL